MDEAGRAAVVDRLDGELEASLRAESRPERAVGEARYLKSRLVHYGVPVPVARRLVRGLLRDNDGLDRDTVLALAERLWDQPADAPVHERRLLAALLMSASEPMLTKADLTLVVRFVREGRTWALVDVLACDVAGPLTDRLGSAATPTLDRWAVDGDFWVRRLALLAHERALRAGGGDWERFTRYADAMLEEKEFFIRKAIGWVLRSASRRRPQQVYEWVLPRAHRASGVTLREAVKYLPPERAAEVMAASGRPRRSPSAPQGTEGASTAAEA